MKGIRPRLAALVLVVAVAPATGQTFSGFVTMAEPTRAPLSTRLIADPSSSTHTGLQIGARRNRATRANPNRAPSGSATANDTSCSESVDVQVDADACGSLVAFSLFGDSVTGGGVAVAGTGDASNTSFFCGPSSTPVPGNQATVPVGAGCVAVSGTGNASNSTFACGFSGRGFYPAGVGAGCVAASLTGNATNTTGACGVTGLEDAVGAGCVALSGSGTASNTGGGACGYGVGPSAGCVAASGTGDAVNENECGLNWARASAGCVAASVAGDASNAGDRCALGATGGTGIGCVAASVGGNASNTNGSCGAQDGGTSAGCVAASVLGTASNTTDDESCSGKLAIGSICRPEDEAMFIVGILSLIGA
jgi:hypothetical protein